MQTFLVGAVNAALSDVEAGCSVRYIVKLYMFTWDLQFHGLIPVDDVARESERLHVNDVYVAALCSNVQPLALERQVAVCDSKVKTIRDIITI